MKNFPETILDFQFEKYLDFKPTNDSRIVHNFEFALYRDSNGRKAVAKHWSRESSKKNYFWLKNEARVYKFLNNLSQQTSSELALKHPKVKIPKFYATTEGQNSFTLLIEYVEGATIQNLPATKKVEIYSDLIRYFEDLSHLENLNTSGIIFRTWPYLLGVFILAFLLSCVKYPAKLPILFRSLGIFLAGLPQLVETNNLRFAHRDLGDYNVIALGDQAWLIDFQLLVITNFMFEYADLVYGQFEDPKFFTEFMQIDLMQKIKEDGKQYLLFKSASVYCAMFDLGIGSEIPSDTIFSFLRRINRLKPEPQASLSNQTINT